MKTLARLIALTASFFAPVIAFAQTSVGVGFNSQGGWFLGIGSGTGFGGYNCAGNTICAFAVYIIWFINNVLVPVLFGIAFIVFLYGVAQKYIFSHGDAGKVGEGHKLILWGIIGFAVMVSLWGIVNVVSNTFGLAGYPAPWYPRSY